MGEQALNGKGEDRNFKLASVAKPPKKPPPESSESIRLRALVIFSFWAVVILLGLPVWLWTTSIHRAHLPLQDMLDWAQGKVFSTFLIIGIQDRPCLGLQTYLSPTNSY